MGSYQLPIDAHGQSLTVFELISWLKKQFCASARPEYDYKYCSRSYCFVERQKCKTAKIVNMLRTKY